MAVCDLGAVFDLSTVSELSTVWPERGAWAPPVPELGAATHTMTAATERPQTRPAQPPTGFKGPHKPRAALCGPFKPVRSVDADCARAVTSPLRPARAGPDLAPALPKTRPDRPAEQRPPRG